MKSKKSRFIVTYTIGKDSDIQYKKKVMAFSMNDALQVFKQTCVQSNVYICGVETD